MLSRPSTIDLIAVILRTVVSIAISTVIHVHRLIAASVLLECIASCLILILAPIALIGALVL